MNASHTVYRSGQLARLAGVSTDTLRHYERAGVIPAPRRSANGYREYPAATLDRVRLVRRALAIGFTLAELSRILRDRDGGGRPCRRVRALAAVKLASVESQIANLTVARGVLMAVLADWDLRLARTPRGRRAGLLDALDTVPAGGHLTNRPLPSREQAS